jgi:hypothetical protein
MKAKSVLAHVFLSLVLYNMMALGINQVMEVGGGYLWIFMALGGAFMLGMQAMGIVYECNCNIVNTTATLKGRTQ